MLVLCSFARRLLTTYILYYEHVCSFSPMQELTLWGLVAGVNAFIVDAKSLKVQDSLFHKCTFPVRELLGTQWKLLLKLKTSND